MKAEQLITVLVAATLTSHFVYLLRTLHLYWLGPLIDLGSLAA